MNRIALGLEYDGTHFSGWQVQPGQRTVQAVLQQAIAQFLVLPEITVMAAGRTDAGVHASGQVVHLGTALERPLNAWVRGVNAHLPQDVAVRWALPVPSSFHARFSALGRAYRYTLYNHPVRAPLQRQQAAWAFRPLNETLMAQAAQSFIGTHDFSSFRSSECQAKTPVRSVRQLKVQRRGDFIYIDIEADAFLHHMVRNIVGTLVVVGQGKQPVAWVAQVLVARDRSCAAPTHAACGLSLVKVTYPPEYGLPDN